MFGVSEINTEHKQREPPMYRDQTDPQPNQMFVPLEKWLCNDHGGKLPKHEWRKNE